MHQLQGSEAASLFFGLIIVAVYAAVFVVLMAVTALIYWKVWAKTGQPGALGLLQLLPIVNLVMLLILAFGEWPIERELRELRGRLAALTPGPAAPPAAGDTTLVPPEGGAG